MALDPATLLVRIDEAFGDEPYPGDDHIVRAASDLESARIRDVLAGSHWRDVAYEDLERLHSALPFLSAEGYRFYLPAFMAFSIVDFQRAGTIPDEVVRSLTPPLPTDIDRISRLAKTHPEAQPFGSKEWDALMAATREALGPGGPAESVFSERAAGFGADQAGAIRAFLEYMRDVHGDDFPLSEPAEALDRYWCTRRSETG
jgi:hypothetical protein